MRRVPISLVFILLTLVRPSMQGPAPAELPAVPGQFTLEPVGDVIRTSNGEVAEGSLPVAFVRSPDDTGPDRGGRYLIAVNSGYGVQLNAKSNEGQQLLQVIDLSARPSPTVVQSVYFPTPQSVNVGVAFGRKADSSGAWPLYASGGVQDRVWLFTFTPGAAAPISPGNDASSTPVSAQSISLSSVAPGSRIKVDRQSPGLLYPTGLAVSASGKQLFVANNLADSLAVVPIATPRKIHTIPLSHSAQRHTLVYPYDVVTIGNAMKEKIFVSLWNEAAVAVVDPHRLVVKRRIATGTHPSALLASADGRRLFVACANNDTVSVIDTTAEREIERIPVGLRGTAVVGNSTQALALDASGRTLFVGNAQSDSVAVVSLSDGTLDTRVRDTDDPPEADKGEASRSRVAGYVPTARYPSALAVVDGHLFIGNGKGEPPARPNAPTADFPPDNALRGAYSVSLMRSSIRRVALPDGSALATMTTAVMRANGLMSAPLTSLFPGPSPITHVIYIIKENRTYDQVLGDVAASGDGTPADGSPALALFGSGDTARKHRDVRQSIAPNHRALALRFGLFDRFFVNAEASADGHNWSTAAYSSDYVDKAFRLNYSGRGRTYDYEGFNRLPDYEPPSSLPPLLRLPVTAADVVRFMRGYVPYLNAQRDAAEPDSLYIWDAAAKAGLSYRSYGEFVGTMSAADVDALNARKRKTYPDISPTVAALPTKRALEEHHSSTFRAFDMFTPDAFTPESYRAAKAGGVDGVIRLNHTDPRFRGTSRLGAWLDEFDGFVADLGAGKGDHLPGLTILRFPNDHTNGLRNGHATPQFMVADNDYAVGRLVEAVSHSPYWKSTAIFVLEDDSQSGPDHVDAHRSPVLVISAWNRPGQLVRAVHNTVSLIRTIELLLGIAPMNQLDAAAIPMDVFRNEADLTPYTAELPNVADDNLIFTRPRSARDRYYIDQTARQDLQNADMADPRVLNEIIWYSVRGDEPMPEPARWAGADALQSGLDEAGELANADPATRARLALARAVERAHKARGATAR